MDFHSHFSNDPAHNADTTFEYMNKFIHWFYDNEFPMKDGIIYYTKYGCSKKYRFENAMCLLSILEFTHIVIIYRCINDPGHGRIKIYGTNGSNKTHS